MCKIYTHTLKRKTDKNERRNVTYLLGRDITLEGLKHMQGIGIGIARLGLGKGIKHARPYTCKAGPRERD